MFNLKRNKALAFLYTFGVAISVLFNTEELMAQKQSSFTDFRQSFVNQYWQIRPSEALSSGFTRFDSVIFVPDEAWFGQSMELLVQLSEELATFNPDTLPVNDRTDWWMMYDRLEADKWYIAQFREHEWNPAWYNVGGDFATLISSRKDPLNQKLRIISRRLENVELYFQAARSNLKNPVREHTELAILQNTGSIDVIHVQLRDSVAKSSLSKDEKSELIRKIDVARESIQSYIEFLRAMLDSKGDDDFRPFRIGKELYDQKFQHDLQSGYTATQIFEKAQQRKDELHISMAELARGLWSKYMGDTPMPDEDRRMIRMVIDKISEKFMTPVSFMSAVEKQIPELIDFVKEKDLLYIDPSKPLVIRKTPGYLEGSGALVTISAPGPYDATGNTYYNVSPLSSYAAEKAESLLREYNHYVLQILNIHEAIPGHYTQLVYANKVPSLIKSIMGNGAMIEGWAVYTERMMLEEGYGNNEPEMWLMYYKWHLRSVCNTILDYSVHTQGWTEKVAVKFLTDEAFQEEGEAGNKWRRATLSQVQLCSYFTGYSEIWALREIVKFIKQDQFNLKEFHEEFLSYGSAPVKYIRQMMLKEK